MCQWLAAAMLALGIAAPALAQYFPDDRNSCRSCHVDERNRTDFCELFEAAIYEKDDKHAKAFYLLHESDPRDPQKGQAKRFSASSNWPQPSSSFIWGNGTRQDCSC